MEIVSNYEEIISFYNNKLNLVEEEWTSSMRDLTELIVLLEDGWHGRASEEAVLKIEELKKEQEKPLREIDDIRRALASLGLAIEEEMRKLAEEEAKRLQMAEAMLETESEIKE